MPMPHSISAPKSPPPSRTHRAQTHHGVEWRCIQESRNNAQEETVQSGFRHEVGDRVIHSPCRCQAGTQGW